PSLAPEEPPPRLGRLPFRNGDAETWHSLGARREGARRVGTVGNRAVGMELPPQSDEHGHRSCKSEGGRTLSLRPAAGDFVITSTLSNDARSTSPARPVESRGQVQKLAKSAEWHPRNHSRPPWTVGSVA